MADKPNKLAFLSMQAPAGYVAGLGRGASGFTTRADIGPARLPAAPTTGGPSAPKGDDDADDGAADDDGGDDDEGRFQDPENETGLFAGAVYEKDDEEADRIWEAVDAKMDQRRRKFRDAREREERERARADKPQVQAQFADLKRGLSSVTEDEWAALADPGSATGKRRKAAAKREARNTRSFAISDTILVANRDRNAVESALTQDQMNTADGIASLAEIGEARNKIFSHQLDQASSSSSSALSGTATSIDPKGYLTELSSSVIKTDAEIGDIAKARTLLDSVIKTNPRHAPGWIAAARVEEVAGKMSSARKIISQGCEHCPRSEDIWLEAARLNTTDNAKVILARSIQHVSTSVNIWLKAVELESDPESKKRVLRKSLEYIPHSVKLWKELVNLEENPEDARILLSGAVAAVPMSIELWLALARLSPPNDAKKVLNEARKTIPTSHEIWIAAARLLEETEGDEGKVDKTVAAAVKALKKAGCSCRASSGSRRPKASRTTAAHSRVRRSSRRPSSWTWTSRIVVRCGWKRRNRHSSAGASKWHAAFWRIRCASFPTGLPSGSVPLHSSRPTAHAMQSRRCWNARWRVVRKPRSCGCYMRAKSRRREISPARGGCSSVHSTPTLVRNASRSLQPSSRRIAASWSPRVSCSSALAARWVRRACG